MNNFDDEFIKKNNERILAMSPPYQARYFPEKKEDAKNNELSVEERMFLITAFTHIGLPLIGLQKELGWNADKLVKNHKSAMLKGACTTAELNLSGKKGGLGKYIILSHDCIARLGLSGYIEKSRGGTDTVHQYLQRLECNSLKEKKYMVEVEWENKVDILATKEDKRYAIEIVLSTEKTEADKLQHLANVDKVIFVCKNKRDMEGLKAEFDKRTDLPPKPGYTICEIARILNCKDLEEI